MSQSPPSATNTPAKPPRKRKPEDGSTDPVPPQAASTDEQAVDDNLVAVGGLPQVVASGVLLTGIAAVASMSHGSPRPALPMPPDPATPGSTPRPQEPLHPKPVPPDRESEKTPTKAPESKPEVPEEAPKPDASESTSTSTDTGAPWLTLKNDTGRMRWDDQQNAFVVEQEAFAHDGITKDGTLIVSGLKEGAKWMYSVDDGQSWTTGVGNEISASELGDDGQKSVLTKQIAAAITESGISSFSFVLDTHVAKPELSLKKVDSMGETTYGARIPFTDTPTVVLGNYEEGAMVEGALDSKPITAMQAAEIPLELQPSVYVDGRVHSLEGWRQTDIAGNVSEVDLGWTFAVTTSLTPSGQTPADAAGVL